MTLMMKVWLLTAMTLMIMKTTKSPRKKKQSITTVGLETSINYSLTKASTKPKPTSATSAYMVTPKKTSSSNTKKTAMASIRIQHE